MLSGFGEEQQKEKVELNSEIANDVKKGKRLL